MPPSLLDIIVSNPPELEEPPAKLGEACSLVLTMACYFAGVVACILAVTALARALRRRRQAPPVPDDATGEGGHDDGR